MPPFVFESEEFQAHEHLSDENEGGDFKLDYPSSPEDERDAAEVDGALTFFGPPGLQNFGLRRAHTSMSGYDVQDGNDLYEPLVPPSKRRRTIDTDG
jgi:hypothetical protein